MTARRAGWPRWGWRAITLLPAYLIASYLANASVPLTNRLEVFLSSHLVGGSPTPIQPTSPQEWLFGWQRLAIGATEWIPWQVPLIAVSGLAASIWFWRGRQSGVARAIACGTGALLIAAAVEFLVVGTIRWVKYNGYRGLYVVQGMAATVVAATLPFVVPFFERWSEPLADIVPAK